MKNKYIIPILTAIVGAAVLAMVVLFGIFPKSQTIYVPINVTSTGPTTTPTTTTSTVVTTTPKAPTSTPTPTTTMSSSSEMIPGVKSVLYINKANGFQIWYPKTAQLIKSNDIFQFATKHGVARIMLPESLFKGTNLIEAGVGISVDSDPQAVADCMFRVAGREQFMGVSTISGVHFNLFSGSEGAAGHLYEYNTYRTVYKGICYEIVEAINSADIGVYEPGTIKEFDRTFISRLISKIVSTFEFIK